MAYSGGWAKTEQGCGAGALTTGKARPSKQIANTAFPDATVDQTSSGMCLTSAPLGQIEVIA